MNWLGKRVLVTGAGGFIASHLAETLVKAGADVTALVHYNALGSWGWLDQSPIRGDMKVIGGDIADRDSVKQAMNGSEIVFHLAALIAIPYSYRAPQSYVQTNIIGTMNMLQAARELGIERLVHTSTSEVYGTAQYVPIDEKHPLQGQSPYSASKIGADKLAESFYLSFDVPVITVRPFNTYGPRQSARAVIPAIITQCLTKNTIRLGNLTPTRDLNYVANTVQGFMLAGATPEAVGTTINIGSGQEVSIGDLAMLIAKLMGREIIIESDQQRLRPDNSEVDRLLADNSLAQKLLGWQPTYTLEQGLQETITWIETHIERYKPDVYTV